MTASASYDAAMLSRGWLAVALASGRDKDTPVLHRTLHVEHYQQGVRLSATDRYMILRSWVPNTDDLNAPEPALDELPEAEAVAIDSDGRGAGLLNYLFKLSTAEDAEAFDIILSLGVPAEDTAVALLPGMEVPTVTLQYPGRETVRLRTYDGPFPDWRPLVAQFQPETTPMVALNPALVGRLAKLGGLYPTAPLLWSFGGAENAAHVEVGKAEPRLEGLVMPMRWEWDAPDQAGIAEATS